MSKILIIYATAGIGHKKAALAVKEAFDKKGKKGVLLVDVLDYTTKFFKLFYNVVYIFLVRYLPTLWGFFYYILDNPLIYSVLRPLRRLVNHLNSKKLIAFLITTKPDTIIATHFMPINVVSDLKKRGVLKTRLISVMTDYKSHKFWFSKYVDSYVVGSEYTKNDLIKRGIPPDRIQPFGIPCAKSFSEEKNIAALKSEMGLDPAKKTIFILGGGFGIGPIKRLVLYLDKVDREFQGIVVCGYNKKLYTSIERITQTTTHKFKNYRFVNNIDELMAVSDVLVSKSGGISVTEALNAGLPMIVIHPIPGQEMRNYKFLEKHNAALKIRNPKEITRLVEGLFGSNKLDVLKENIMEVRRINSAERVANETS